MTYYPVGIPTLCRYEHFKRCVESLARNTHADKTELVIGLDYPPSDKYYEGYNKICEYVDSIDGFAKVTILRHKNNLGAVVNTERIKEYCYNHYDAMIYSEDDNEFSPCFLDFVNKGLNKYKDSTSVVSVCGYSHVPCYKHKTNTYFSYNSCAWGFGIWRKKEQKLQKVLNDNKYFYDKLYNLSSLCFLFRRFPSSVLMVMNVFDMPSSDVKRSIYNMFEKTYQLRPTISMVRNCGQDGSGLHSGKNKSFLEQEIQKIDRFDIDEEPTPAEAPLNMNFYKKTSMPDNPIKRILYYPYTIFKLLKYKFDNNI